jgi:hypothetical protein
VRHGGSIGNSLVPSVLAVSGSGALAARIPRIAIS